VLWMFGLLCLLVLELLGTQGAAPDLARLVAKDEARWTEQDTRWWRDLVHSGVQKQIEESTQLSRLYLSTYSDVRALDILHGLT
jgi:hypothetical protein